MRRAFLPVTLALCVLAFAGLGTSTLRAVPITMTLDNPNQTVIAPSNGFLTVVITGTISIDPNYHVLALMYNNPSNLAHTNALNLQTSAEFAAFQSQGTGNFSGPILEITVPAETPPDLYAYRLNNNNLALFQIVVIPNLGGAMTAAEQNYSVLVTTQGSAVPDNDVTLLLLGLTVAILFFARRMFVLKAWPTTG